MLIDSHCHLNYDYSPKSTSDILSEAKAQGVVQFLTIGTDLKSIDAVAKVSEDFENVFHTVGVHPHDAIDLNLNTPDDLARLRAAAKHPKCRAIGEIGLDYHYNHSPREVQIAALSAQLELALELNLPIVIHSRDGEADLLPLLSSYTGKIAPKKIPGVIHCFTGTQEFGKACLDLGFMISFSGIITFKKADDLRACVQAFPLSQILVETDSPYLAPVPFRGKKCEPSMVRVTAMKVAELKGVSFEEVARVTSENTKALFGI